MRWWLLALFLVALLSLTLTLLHPARATIGATLLGAIDRDTNTPPTPARGAILLVDFTPDPAALRNVQTALWNHGEGALPYTGIPSRTHSRWIQGPDVEFTWNSPSNDPDAAPVDPLRAALHSPSRAEGSVRFAMDGQSPATVENAIVACEVDFARLSDEDLFRAWLKADRALLAEANDLHDAVRQILLLKARPIIGPVLVFGMLGHTYIVPGEPLLAYSGPSQDIYAELDTYDLAGRLRWSGRLRIIAADNKTIPAERVRITCARITQFVNELLTPPSTTSATAPMGLQFLHQPP